MTARRRRLGEQRLDQAPPGGGAVHHRDGHRPVERDRVTRRHPVEHGVQLRDLRPVGPLRGGGVGVHGRDRRLQLVAADRPGRQHLLEQRHTLGDRRTEPPGAVLLGQRHQVTRHVGPRRRPGVGEQRRRSRGQARGLVVDRFAHSSYEADRLVRQGGVEQVGAGRPGVPLREHQVAGVEHRGETPRQLARRRHRVRGATRIRTAARPPPAAAGPRARASRRRGRRDPARCTRCGPRAAW
jgi:hypothetical protein